MYTPVGVLAAGCFDVPSSASGDEFIAEMIAEGQPTLHRGCDKARVAGGGDGVLHVSDFFAYQDVFKHGDPTTDHTGDKVYDIFNVFTQVDLLTAEYP